MAILHGRDAFSPPPGARGRFWEVLALAGWQHWVVARWQLSELGVERGWIAHQVAAGTLHRVHQGVYAVGRPHLTRRGRWMAAVLAGGPDAALSHRDAAALHGQRQTSRLLIDVTVPGARGLDEPGVQIHNVRSLHPDDVMVVDGIPVTTPERTLLDLCDVLRPVWLEKPCERSYGLRLLEPRRLHRQLHAPGRRTRTLRGALRVPPSRARSEAERRMAALLTRHVRVPFIQNLWLPEAQAEADFIWLEHRLVLELDVHASHRTPHGIERDAAKDARLRAIGLRVLRARAANLETVRRVQTALTQAGGGD